MTLMTEHEIRQAFASLRKLTAYSGPHGNQTCGFEEALVELARREARVPTALTRVDGFSAGGNGGGGVNRNDAGQPASSTERATLAILDADQRRKDHDDDGSDPVGERIVSALWTLDMLSKGAVRVRDKVTEAQRLFGQRKPAAKVAEVCGQDGCDDIAEPGRRGNCPACAKWLQRHPDVTRVPAEVIARRNERRTGKGVHVDGPFAPHLDPLIERLVDDFDEDQP